MAELGADGAPSRHIFEVVVDRPGPVHEIEPQLAGVTANGQGRVGFEVGEELDRPPACDAVD